jgi:cell division protein FtsB
MRFSWTQPLKRSTTLVFFCNPRYKRKLEALFRSLSLRLRMRRAGYIIAFALAVVYGLVALRGPQGVSALLDKRQEVRQLEEQNAAKAAENERRRERIRRLEESSTEQEMEIRKQLKLLRPGETTFILPDAPKTDAPPKQP